MIVRDWYEILSHTVTHDGRCAHCEAKLPGRYERFDGTWGRRRVPVRVATARL